MNQSGLVEQIDRHFCTRTFNSSIDHSQGRCLIMICFSTSLHQH